MLVAGSVRTDAEKKELLREILGNNTEITQKDFAAYSKIINYIGKVDDVFTFAEFLPIAARILQSPLMRIASSGTSFLSIFLFPFDSFIKLWNASRVDLTMYSYRASSYAITAWAFSEPVPSQSQAILKNASLLHPSHSYFKDKRTEYDASWKQATRSSIGAIERYCSERELQSEHVKLVFRALSDGNRGKLSELIMRGFEDKIPVAARRVYISNYGINYPS